MPPPLSTPESLKDDVVSIVFQLHGHLNINKQLASDVNKDFDPKAKAKDLSAKAKDLGPKAKANDSRCQGHMFQWSF